MDPTGRAHLSAAEREERKGQLGPGGWEGNWAGVGLGSQGKKEEGRGERFGLGQKRKREKRFSIFENDSNTFNSNSNSRIRIQTE